MTRSALPRSVALVSAAWAVLGCAQHRATSLAAPYPVDPRFEERDLRAYAITPAERRPRTDGVALALDGGEEQARTTALELVRALIDADTGALDALFAPRLVFALEGQTRPRGELIARCTKDSGALHADPRPLSDERLDLESISARRADAYHLELALPRGIQKSDWVVTLPQAPANAPANRRAFCVASIYVRPGPHPEIVGIVR